MNERKKAQDVFNETNFVFAQKTTFEKAFPQIKEIKVEISESGNGVYRGGRTIIYSKNDIGEYVNCSNPACYNGGVNVGQVIRDMVFKKESDREDTVMCQGYEGSPKGRKRYRNCWNEFAYKIKIDFIDEVAVAIEEDVNE